MRLTDMNNNKTLHYMLKCPEAEVKDINKGYEICRQVYGLMYCYKPPKDIKRAVAVIMHLARYIVLMIPQHIEQASWEAIELLLNQWVRDTAEDQERQNEAEPSYVDPIEYEDILRQAGRALNVIKNNCSKIYEVEATYVIWRAVIEFADKMNYSITPVQYADLKAEIWGAIQRYIK